MTMRPTTTTTTTGRSGQQVNEEADEAQEVAAARRRPLADRTRVPRRGPPANGCPRRRRVHTRHTPTSDTVISATPRHAAQTTRDARPVDRTMTMMKTTTTTTTMATTTMAAATNTTTATTTTDGVKRAIK